MRPTAPATTNAVRAFVATIPEPDLRTLAAEFVAVLLRCLVASPGSSPEVSETLPRGNGRRRLWSQARREAHNAKVRERRAAKAGAAGNGRRRRGRKRAKAEAPLSEPAANGQHAVSAEALWEHAAKLEPKAPWRAVVRELGVAEVAAQVAHRAGTMPPCAVS